MRRRRSNSNPVSGCTGGGLFVIALTVCCVVSPSALRAQAKRVSKPSSRPAGVTASIERSIANGLRFIARQQGPDGSFGMDRNSRQTYPTAISSMVGLAFLASGSTPTRGPYARELRMITEYLLKNSVRAYGDTAGFLTNDNAWEQRPTYCHAFAMTYLAQIYGMERDAKQRQRLRKILDRAILLSAQTQTYDGGWGYGPNYHQDEGTLVVTVLQGLRACRDVGLFVPKKVIDDGVQFIERSTRSDGAVRYRINSGQVRPGVSCAAIVALWNAGRYNDPLLHRIRSYVERNVQPQWTYGHHQEYVLYYHAQATFVLGGKGWLEFYKEASSQLVTSQSSDGSFEGADGGDLFGTAVALLVLQMPYQRVSVYQR